MNRQIKFRVWDVTNKKFLPQSHFAILGNGKLIVSDSGHYIHFTNTNKEDYIVQEYTGLIDKYDNPIYEGDIVKWDNLNYLVEWNDIGYKWQGRCPYYHPYHHPTTESFRDLMNGVIIGNYFENNELLK